MSPLASAGERVRFDLEMHLRMQPEGNLRGTVVYSTDLFDAATIERMVGHFQTLLNGIVADPDTKIGRLPLLTEAERRQLLVEWNDTRRDYPRDKCVHELFEEQAERTPEAVAVICGDRAADLPAAERSGEPVGAPPGEPERGPGALVGVFLERSLDLITSLIGDPEGRRRVSAAGSGDAAATPGIPASRRSGAARADRKRRCAIGWRRRGRSRSASTR